MGCGNSKSVETASKSVGPLDSKEVEEFQRRFNRGWGSEYAVSYEKCAHFEPKITDFGRDLDF
jgi:hypothetical protein